MKKIVILVFLSLMFLPVPMPRQTGVYNTFSGLIYCQPSACIHEVGHKLDDESGWVSSTPEFQMIVDEMGLDLWANDKENYASIFAFANGREENMPDKLKEFYDWELAAELIGRYEE